MNACLPRPHTEPVSVVVLNETERAFLCQIQGDNTGKRWVPKSAIFEPYPDDIYLGDCTLVSFGAWFARKEMPWLALVDATPAAATPKPHLPSLPIGSIPECQALYKRIIEAGADNAVGVYCTPPAEIRALLLRLIRLL